ncbi:MAG: DUF1616 domain-containing protein [Methanocella sp.]
MYQNEIGGESPKGVKSGEGADALPASGLMAGKLITAFLIVTMTVSAGLALYIIAVPHQGQPFTEFYILGPGGKADNYPSGFGPGEQKTVRVGIVNHENTYKTYDLVVVLNDSKALTTLYEEKIGLGNRETLEKAIVLTPNRTGSGMRIEFLLYKDNDRSVPYRDLYLQVNVTDK